MNIWHRITTSLSIYFILACTNQSPEGRLLVNAPGEGSFEIYRVVSEAPLQFISEQIGSFNKELSLPPGSYLVLADCSHENVIIRPGKQTRLTAHELRFVPPTTPSPKDSFSIQCNRFDKTRSRQNLSLHFSLNVLAGKRDLLVGMVPLSIDLKDAGPNGAPRTISYDLGGIQVAAYPEMPPATLFFLSPIGELLAVTEPQAFGHWQFLLPGSYLVEVNGTVNEVKIEPLEQRIIRPAFLQIKTPENLNNQLAEQIGGNPIYVELNERHWLNLNELYPVLPGNISLQISTSARSLSLNLLENQHHELKTKSIKVNYDCAPWEWLCLGGRAIYLYERDGSAPIATGITDVPLLYFEDEVWVSIEGSRDIKAAVPKQEQVEVGIGKLRLTPKYFHRSGQVTDLVRIEAGSDNIVGQSIDLELERPTEIPLIAGSYNFAQYISLLTIDGERRKSKRSLQVHVNETIDIPFQVLVSEKKWATIRGQSEDGAVLVAPKPRKVSLFRPAISLKTL